jgi:hypothetical protein
MQTAGHVSFTRLARVREHVQVPVVLLLVTCLAACSASMQKKPGATAQGRAGDSVEARLQALEAGMQHLAQRVDTLQSTTGSTRSAALGDVLPPEYQPVKPTVVLASHGVQKAPVQPAQPLHVPSAAPAVMPQAAPPEAPVKPQPRKRQREGDWVINLASYRSHSYAARKQAEFADKGVDVEQVQAEVKGKTIYRLCVTGFGSSRAAKTEAAGIQTRLGLGSTWIARR